MLVGLLLEQLMRWGSLRVIDAHGRLHTYAGEPGPSATIRLHDRALHSRLFWNPRLYAGEAYMDGTLTLEDGTTIFDFLDLVGANLNRLDETRIVQIRNALARLVRIPGFRVDHRRVVLSALTLFGSTNLDFGDCMLVASMRRAGSQILYSFDTDFDRLPTIQRQEP